MNVLKKVIPCLIIVASVAVALYSFSTVKNVEDEIADAEAKKIISDSQLERYKDIDSHYGRASNDFYASKPIVVLRGNGASETIRIYRSNESGLNAARDPDILETAWDTDDGQWANYRITSKASNGYQTVDFTNKNSGDTFSVLVIIR